MSQFAFLVLFNADIILLEPVLWVAAVSTGGPGEMSGTVRSAETTRSSLAHSGTGKTPERCFGNSGGNWSADNLTASQARLSLRLKAPAVVSCLEAPD